MFACFLHLVKLKPQTDWLYVIECVWRCAPEADNVPWTPNIFPDLLLRSQYNKGMSDLSSLRPHWEPTHKWGKGWMESTLVFHLSFSCGNLISSLPLSFLTSSLSHLFIDSPAHNPPCIFLVLLLLPFISSPCDFLFAQHQLSPIDHLVKIKAQK